MAEKDICADPALAQADADVAKNYATALKALDPRAGKALRDDQGDFIQYRDQIAGFNEDTPKDQQTFDLGEFLRDRATFVGGIRKPADTGFVGTWTSIRGTVEIKAADAGKLEVSEESHANQLTAFDITADGSLANRRIWADLDGICPDGEGAVWYADVPNKCCVRVTERNEVLQTVAVDRGCFACMMGGEGRKTSSSSPPNGAASST